MANQIIQSIKTIAQSLVDNAGYDKTRGGLIVGVNTITNTYSVKVDGVTYPIVRAVDDATYNIGDVVKVVIPCNQATQMYISSSVLSDNSLGNKIANATGLAEDAGKLGLDNQLEIQKVSDVANSKNKTFRQDTEPTSGMSSGDVWIDISDNNTLYVYDGTQWVFSGGGNGQDGLNNATILLYQRGTTAPEKPTAEVTYTFADASLSPTSALNGWTQAIPEIDGNPCWVIAATASATTATDTIGISEWSTQIKFVEDGAQGATGATGATGKTGEVGATGSTGLNQATIFLYSRTTSTKPSSPTTYTFATGILSPLPSDWSRSVPTNDGNPCYVTTAIAIGYGSDVTITANAWSDPTVLVENGAEGYSPTVSTGTSSDGSTTITVTNKDGSTTTELVDGTARDDATNAAKTATSYITDINENSGIKVGAKNNVNNYVQVNSNGTSVYQDINNSAVRVASLGANGVVLGVDKNAQTIVTADGITIANASGIVGVSVDSSGISQVATKVVNVYASIPKGGSYTLTLDSSIASGTSLKFKVELDSYPEFSELCTITVGTNKSETFSGNVQFSYVYNATNKQITITANSTDSVVLCFYRYDVASDLPLVQLNGVLEFNGNQQKDIKIEVGTSGNWTYEKWSSGIVKMYYTGTYSSAFNNGNYFGAYRGTAQTLTYPFTLASVAYVNVDHIAPNTGFCVLSTYDTTQLKFYPYNRTNQTATQTDIKVIAEVVGRWKRGE